MALELSIDVSESTSGRSMTIYDKTLAYNSSTNTTGYGGINYELIDLQSAYFLVTLPGSSTPIQVDISLPSATLPEETGNVIHYITNEDLGYSSTDQLPDGYYEVTLVERFVDDTTLLGYVDYSVTVNVFFFVQVKCCLDKLVARASFESCCTNPLDLMNTIQAYVGLKALRVAIACLKINKANKILGQLQKLCVANSCNC